MKTVKVIEVIGTSEKSWEEAAENAVKTSSGTIENITGVEVVAQTAKVKDGSIVEYRADVKLAFIYDKKLKER
ncbi:MAG: dodecin domain-containing protein [Candidatus Altiarchaeales archaeon]|nr:dodecin domain-containing protein [Candidatus Altiarchaeales archaeon]MBD3416882.1 dodecin domain-containing protein [Candidatus Altiarchaeales archaeon]